MKSILNLLLTLTLISLSLSSFSQNGTIRGKITDANTGESLIGAAVIISGTTKGGSADLDGNFSIENVTPGIYSVVAQYVSYNTDTIPNVVVKAGEVTIMDVTMREKAIDLGVEVEIVARANRASENYLLTMQRKAATVMDGISAQQISRAGDSEAAGAVKRVTGVSVEGGKYVYIRGLSDRYSKTTLNGAEIPGLDPQRNSVQLDLYPTNLLDNITIVKTFTPELPGSFTGGLINMETKDFPEKFTLQFSTSLGYNTNASLNNDFITSENSATDKFGFDNGLRDIPDFVQNTEIQPLQVSNFAIAAQVFGFWDYDNNNFTAEWQNLPNSEKQRLKRLSEIELNSTLSNQGKAFNKNWAPIKKQGSLNQSYSFSVGNQTKLFGKPLGFNIGATYKYNEQFYDDGITGRYKQTGDVSTTESLNEDLYLKDTRGDQNVLWGTLINFSYKLNSNHKIGVVGMHNQSGSNTGRYQIGLNTSEQVGLFQEQRTQQYLERSVTTGQLKGDHQFSKLRMNWIASYSNSSLNTPDMRVFYNSFVVNNQADTTYSIRGNAYSEPSRYYRNMEEENLNAVLNFELPFSFGKWNDVKLRFGGNYLTTDRSMAEERFSYVSQGLTYNGDPASYFSDENMTINANANAMGTPYYLRLREDTEKKNSYTGTQFIRSGYAQIDWNITKDLRIITGARLEQTQIEVLSKSLEDPGLSAEEREKYLGKLDNTDILPALNASYSISEKYGIRAAASRTLARPTFREFSPFDAYDFEYQLVFIGNPQLERTLVDNLDLRFEFYPNPGELIAISTFYKKFNNPIERVINPTAANVEITWKNVGQATVYGAEIELRKSLSFISEKVKNLNVGINLTYVYSETIIDSLELVSIRALDPGAASTRPMYGQSPFIINGFLGYTSDSLGLSANVTFNMSSEKLALVTIGGTPDVYDQPRPGLDLNITKKLGKHFSLSASLQNLLNPSYRQTYEYKGQEYDFQSYKIGRTYSLGLKYFL